MLPATAEASVDEDAAIKAYVRARAADTLGALDQASQGYAAALALSPENEVLAAGALTQALAAGDRKLAVAAARSLERTGRLAPDARLVLLSEALAKRDWRAASAQIDKIEEDEIFSFMAPLLRAWVAHSWKKGDPIALLKSAAEHPLGGVYAAEQRPLMLLAQGETEQGIAELLTATAASGPHARRLRIAAAALLADRGKRKQALALLQEESVPIAAARRQIAAGKPVPGQISTASAGIAEFLVRIAVDLSAQELPSLALSFARIASFLAPDNSETWLLTTELLARGRETQAALTALENVRADDPFAGEAADTRIALLSDAGRQQEALARARAAAEADGGGVDAWVRLGNLHSELKRPTEAAAAYSQALTLAADRPSTDRPEWTLWVLRGSALVEAGNWPEGKAALEQAYKLAPDEAVVLNYLGYSQLERRENIEEAEKLIREASRLQPQDAAITDSLGWALYLRGKIAEAVETLERAAQGEPGDSAINEHLGDAYYAAGRRFEARYAWSTALHDAGEDAAARIRAKIEVGLKPEFASP